MLKNTYCFYILLLFHQTSIWEEFEDTNGVIRICISKKNRQNNGQKKKYKRINNDLQNIHIKLKIEQHDPPLKPGGELRCPGRVQSNWEKFDDTKWVIKIRCIKSYPSIHRPITTYCESHHLTVRLHSTALYCFLH